jgi:tubulin polyglutamylase TTLL9
VARDAQVSRPKLQDRLMLSRCSHSETDWDIFWTNKEWIRGVYDRVHLDNNQRVNHFRNYYEIARKDLLIKNLKRAKRTLAKKGSLFRSAKLARAHVSDCVGRVEESEQYDFFPNTFAMPGADC